jgi:hypothetical protein
MRDLTHSANSFSLGACLQLFPSLPKLKGTRTPTANICALRSASSAGWLTNELIPAYCSWTKYLGNDNLLAHGRQSIGRQRTLDPQRHYEGPTEAIYIRRLLLSRLETRIRQLQWFPLLDDNCDLPPGMVRFHEITYLGHCS